VDYESHAVALGRNELGGLLVAAGLGPPAEHGLVSLLALNGLRVSEATGADIEQLGLERGHRTLTVTRKGGKVVTIPLAPRGPGVRPGQRGTDGRAGVPGRRRAAADRHGAGRIVRKAARRAGISKAVTPPTLRHAFITAALDAGVPLRDVQEAASQLIREPRCGTTGPGAAWTATPHILSPRISRALPSRPHRLATVPPGGHSRQADRLTRMTSRKAVTDRDLNTSANRRCARLGDQDQVARYRCRWGVLRAWWLAVDVAGQPGRAGLFLAHGGGQHFHVRYLGHVGWRGAMIGNMGSAVGSDAGAGGVRSTSLMAC